MSWTTQNQQKFTSIGGQAVIEGVMMRSPHFLAVAVRKPDQKIVIRSQPYLGIATRFPILKKPILRGVVTLIESMAQGVDALGFSAEVSSEDEKTGEKLSTWAIVLSMVTAFALAMGLFVALPHFLTVLTRADVNGPIFHAIDGVLKMFILLAYVYAISLMKDIHRVFQYHGAEHKSIYAFEAGQDLTVENARKFTTLHPRCGTSFLLFLVVISIAVFSIVFRLFGLTRLSEILILNHLGMIGVKIVLMLPVAGIAYEFIKVCAFRIENPFFKALIWPGLMLQKLTTREPTDDQLEVALASLKQVLLREKSSDAVPTTADSKEKSLIEIAGLADLGLVQARVAEFAEN